MLRLHASALAPGAPLRLSRRWGVCARRPATQAAAGASGSSSESGAGTGGGGGEPPQAAAVQIDYRGRRLQAAPGTTLRTALLEAGVSPHNGRAVLINCRGLGTCGTCAVAVQGAVEPAEWTPQERLRLNFPPHSAPNNQRLRLACQVACTGGELRVTKRDGFWGQGDEVLPALPDTPAAGSSSSESSSGSRGVTPLGQLEFVLDRRPRQQP